MFAGLVPGPLRQRWHWIVVGEDDVEMTAGPTVTTDRAALSRAEARRSTTWLKLALVAYGGILLLLLPTTPLEWDEVLFMRAVERYDVASHSPHPPGYPAFVAAGKIVNDVVGDPRLALQLVSVAAAVGVLLLLWRFVRSLGGSKATAAAAAFLTATTPGFLYAAGVGMSDVAGAAAALLAVVACHSALRRSGVLPVASAAVALAAAVRPQVAVVAAIPLAAAVVTAGCNRRWRTLLLAGLSGVGVTGAFWVPAIATTGWPRWLGAMKHQLWWVTVGEAGSHLPAASWRSLAEWWLAGSFVGWEFALPVWALVVIGGIVLVRRGRRRLAALCVVATLSYLLLAVRSMNMTLAIRYFLPVAPYIAILAAGGLEADRRPVRRIVAGLVVAWGVVAVAWTSPALLARLHPEPVWSALTFIRAHFRPADVTVAFDGSITPHVEYVLQRAGFKVVRADRLDVGSLPDDRETLVVAPLPVPEGEVVFAARSASHRVAELAAGRYGSCAVTRLVAGDQPVFSPDWQVTASGWRLWGTGTIFLPEGATPRIVSLRPGHAPLTVRRSGFEPVRLAPWQRVSFPLVPGPLGALEVSAPDQWMAAFEPPVVTRFATVADSAYLASEWVVPIGPAVGGPSRPTDLYLYNPNGDAISVTGSLIGEDVGSASACVATTRLDPGEQRWVRDLAATLGCGDARRGSAVLVRSAGGDDARFHAVGRLRSSPAAGAAVGLPVMRGDAAIHPWESVRLFLGTDVPRVGRLSLLCWSERPVTAEVSVLDPEERLLARRLFRVEGFESPVVDLSGIGVEVSLDVRLLEAPDDALLIPFLVLGGSEGSDVKLVLPAAREARAGRTAILSARELPRQDRPRHAV